MSYAIINARRYFVLLNYQYGLKRKKIAMGGGGFRTLVPRDTRHPPFHYSTASVLVPCQVLNIL